jgi:SAM-dependent methyltransferase
MNPSEDAYGQMLLDQFLNHKKTSEIIVRDDGQLDFGSEDGLYFTVYDEWPPAEKEAVGLVRGRVLDVGCGAGRHALYLQEKGFDVLGIDISPGAIDVCRRRGLKKAEVLAVENVDRLEGEIFDTILMLGNNFGLLGNPDKAKTILEKFARLTPADGRLIAGTFDPYKTDDPNHLAYHKMNRLRNRLPGQVTMRVCYKQTVSPWFEYLFASPEEMREILEDTARQVKELLPSEKAHYFAVIEKKNS